LIILSRVDVFPKQEKIKKCSDIKYNLFFALNQRHHNISIYLQATFVCTQTESSIPCEESEKYYTLNEDIGKEVEEEEEADQDRGKKNATKILEPEVETVLKKSSSKNSRLLSRERIFRLH